MMGLIAYPGNAVKVVLNRILVLSVLHQLTYCMRHVGKISYPDIQDMLKFEGFKQGQRHACTEYHFCYVMADASK